MLKRPDYTVRPMNFIDNDQVLDILQSMGITVGNHTNLTMLKVDPNCILVAEDTDTGKLFNLVTKIFYQEEYYLAHYSYDIE